MGAATVLLRENVFPREFTLLFVFVAVAAALIFLGILVWGAQERRERKKGRHNGGA